MKDALAELIGKISSGCMGDEEILRVADEAAQAYADPQAFLTANPDINYDDSFPIPLGEWVVVGSLPETVLFQADTYADLFEQIVQSFGKDVTFNIKSKQLSKVEPLVALNRIQIQLSSMNKEMGGYTLVDFSEPLDDELQAVLVYGKDEARVLELAATAGIHAAPSLQALRG
ncbi:hypothetical protein V2J92_18655 [Pseudomonas alliivorans]|uniref:hypothetical protein n=1 Tax=Pseudomonas alliivorans TaxID=2810613 RepID=UPI001AE1C65F|nr:hypothetical protein [Pseudomonas alliivorans]MBP0940538.1 hypothetical protein [Pseudomonas alliivorans]MEE4879394.1 hypothetical protein [Pseudomonas alliivorans]MEE4930446.1 hypothetical protein [Pseudomonas alliivorans]MEE4935394.1 hypothetical protein [Pseudomonas alliivorans]MEE4942468.1 hypothetical protein [Pseudomonas alliivorans]